MVYCTLSCTPLPVPGQVGMQHAHLSDCLWATTRDSSLGTHAASLSRLGTPAAEVTPRDRRSPAPPPQQNVSSRCKYPSLRAVSIWGRGRDGKQNRRITIRREWGCEVSHAGTCITASVSLEEARKDNSWHEGTLQAEILFKLARNTSHLHG